MSRKSSNIVEEAVLEKRLLEYKKQKEEIEKLLENEEKRVKNLQSQRIDNPKSAYSHPGFKAYLDNQEASRVHEAIVFVKKLAEERRGIEERRNKAEAELTVKLI